MVQCVQCPSEQAGAVPTEASAWVLEPEIAPTPVAPASTPVLDVVDGVAGGSAAREFERRHEARRERVQAVHRKVGKYLLAVFDYPQPTRAWSTGAIGEEALGGMLASHGGPRTAGAA